MPSALEIYKGLFAPSKLEKEIDWKLNFDPQANELYLPLGINLGNNAVKLVGHSHVIFNSFLILDSCIADVTEDADSDSIRNNPNDPSTVVFTIKKTSNTELRGRTLVLGTGAFDLDGKQIGEDRSGKTDSLIPLYLGSIAAIVAGHKGYSSAKNLTVKAPLMLSIPQASLADHFETLLKGNNKHEIVVGKTEVKITFDVLKVIPEGRASGLYIMNQRKCSRGVVLVDLGNGDTQFTYTNAQSKLVGTPEILRDNGVRKLFHSIRKGSTVTVGLGDEADYLSVKVAVETAAIDPNQGSEIVIHQGAKSVELNGDYDKYLDQYLEDKLDRFQTWLGKVNPDRGVQKFAIGGGAKLPKVAQKLKDYGIEVYSDIDPQFVEAFALTWLANRFAQEVEAHG